MRSLVNLASEPFRNRRLFWLAILFIFALPSYLGLRAIESKVNLEMGISARTAAVNGLEAQLRKYQKPVRSDLKISTDQNRELLAAGELIARRTFSWSQLLTDIERNLPTTVRVLRVAVSKIQPEERDGTIGAGQSAATLTLDVIGKSGQDVTGMINKFHESGRFKVTPINKRTVEGTEEVEFALKVDYFPPRPSRPSLLDAKPASGTQAAAGQVAEKR